MNLADKIVSLRTRRGLSQEELAAELGVSRQTIGKWETGQALPELPGLITLSNFFAVAIDSLVKETSCNLATPAAFASDELRPFLLHAKRATYAGYGKEVPACRPCAHEFTYEEGPFAYRDSYFGGQTFHGQEVVYQNGAALWCMNYSGRTLSEHFSGDFLKLALRNNTLDHPYRGPKIYQSSDYTYTCSVDGELDWFCGTETIYHQGEIVYSCHFHGGIVR